MSKFIFDAAATNFEQLVLENSRRGPVVVNFWARGAGPCLRLWPVLEKLVTEYAGRFLLVNVNTDNENRLSREQGVTSVPTLKVYRRGEVVETVHGAESENTLRQLIDRHVPRESDRGIAEALSAWQRGEQEAAHAALEALAQSDPQNPRIALAHAKLLLGAQRYEEAARVLAGADARLKDQREIATLRTHAELLAIAAQAPEREELEAALAVQPDDLMVRLQLAARTVLADDYEAAMEHLLAVLQRDRRFRQDLAARALAVIIDMLGPGSEAGRRYRARMFELLA
ncbi:MAG: tetratricopeptide repeat protein [Pseudomonadota bacterium]|nr:MAG: tetratricopeptide repeat protein [Pseudomonadota bacterium]